MDGLPLLSIAAGHSEAPATYLAPLKKGVYTLTFEFLKAAGDSEPHLAIVRYADGATHWWMKQPSMELRGHL